MGLKLLDLTNEVLRGLSWPTVTTVEGTTPALEVQKIVSVINRAAQEISGFFAYPFLKRTYIFNTRPRYKTGTIQATKNSRSVSFQSATLPRWAGVENALITIQSRDEYYRITDVHTAATASIYPEYIGATHATGVTYAIGQDRYALPHDFDRPFDTTQFVTYPGDLTPIPPPEMNTLKAAAVVFGDTPNRYTTYMLDDGRWYIEFDTIAITAYQVRLDYVKTINWINKDEEEFPFPLRMEGVLVDATIYVIKRDQTSDLNAAALLLQDYLRKRAEGSKPTNTTPRMVISPSTSRRTHEQMKAGRWGRYDYGDRWDTFN